MAGQLKNFLTGNKQLPQPYKKQREQQIPRNKIPIQEKQDQISAPSMAIFPNPDAQTLVKKIQSTTVKKFVSIMVSDCTTVGPENFNVVGT